MVEEQLQHETYAFLRDIYWFNQIRYYGTQIIVSQHHSQAKATFERLMTLPQHQEIFSQDVSHQWRQQISEGSIKAEQLRQQLYNQYRKRAQNLSLSDSGAQHLRQPMPSSQLENQIDLRVDRILYAKEYPTIHTAFDFGGLHLVATPTGVTDELCYEFCSMRRAKGWQRRLEGIRILAHMDAYALNRPNVLAHLHVRGSNREWTIREKANKDIVVSFLEWVEKALKDIAKEQEERKARDIIHE